MGRTWDGGPGDWERDGYEGVGGERERGVLEGWEVEEMGRNYSTGLISISQSKKGREPESLNALSLSVMSLCLTK